MDIWLVLILIFVGIIAFALGMSVAKSREWSIRKDAVDRSKSVILWGVYEHTAPLLPWFPYALKDMIFLGKWVDYVVFDGLSEHGSIREVVFIEVKTNKSSLNHREKAIKQAIDAGRVSYRVMRYDTNEGR